MPKVPKNWHVGAVSIEAEPPDEAPQRQRQAAEQERARETGNAVDRRGLVMADQGVELGQAHLLGPRHLREEDSWFAVVIALETEAGHVDRVFVEMRPEVGQVRAAQLGARPRRSSRPSRRWRPNSRARVEQARRDDVGQPHPPLRGDAGHLLGEVKQVGDKASLERQADPLALNAVVDAGKRNECHESSAASGRRGEVWKETVYQEATTRAAAAVVAIGRAVRCPVQCRQAQAATPHAETGPRLFCRTMSDPLVGRQNKAARGSGFRRRSGPSECLEGRCLRMVRSAAW